MSSEQARAVPASTAPQRPGVGVLYRATDQMRFLELAHAAADRGFTSLVLGEHTHIPVSSDPSLFPGAGSSIPDSYRRLLDPYVALSFVAAQTPLKIGTCTSLPAGGTITPVSSARRWRVTSAR